MKRTLAIVLLALFGTAWPAVGLAGDDKEKGFAAPPEKVFAAAAAVVRKHYTVVEINDKEKVITFWTGYSLTSSGFQVTATFEGKDGSTVVRLRPAKRQQLFAWGAGGRVAKKFFEQVREQLAAEAKKP
jgi:hypothetical protein